MATKAELVGRVRAQLMDAGAEVWSTEAVEEGLRLAVNEYGLAGAAAVTVEGLDGALASTLPALHEGMVVWGACGYAALARAVDRAESFQMGSEAGALKGWGETRLREYKAMLGSVFPAYLVVLAASAGEGGSGSDPAKTAAEIGKLSAEADHLAGKEARAMSAAAQAAAEAAAEAARLAEIRGSTSPAWGTWDDNG